MPAVSSAQEPTLSVSSFTVTLPDWNDIVNGAVKVLDFNDRLAKNHFMLYISGCIVLIFWPEIFTWPIRLCKAILLFPFKVAQTLVRALGFGNNTGIERDSLAAHYHRNNYGGYIPPDSYFSRLQSYGAREIYEDGEQVKIPFYARIFQICVVALLVRAFLL
ncbi:hypothetical protein BT96DRAFT_1020168 [Gymnopus androsaceus JB14]|uniref:Uncharacterized protein n=1 Tax=Gymnopus androsaceus JB14 TaxID=1447944 RepID=A0A6A4HJY0_9AGAR|nr:hypothetical protein BT96DRAFT_1020168 [Gymnopus androsaceus JB14]